MMKVNQVMKIIFIIAITMALTITLTMKNLENEEEEKPPFKHTNIIKELPVLLHEKKLIMPSKRMSRFLAVEQKNPRAADQCHKDNEICYMEEGGRRQNSTCCNNKCRDLNTDDKNCGACKQKCVYTEDCCGGECVNLAYDKRHCGACYNRCMPGGYCIYGLCDYA